MILVRRPTTAVMCELLDLRPPYSTTKRCSHHAKYTTKSSNGNNIRASGLYSQQFFATLATVLTG